MKVTFVIPGLAGGGPRVIMEYARGLMDRGHEVRILHGRPELTVKSVLRDLHLKLRYGQRGNWSQSFPGELIGYKVLTPEVVGMGDALVGVGADCTLAVASLPACCGVKVNNCHGRELSNMENMKQAWRLRMPRIVVASYLEKEMRQEGCRDEVYVMHNGLNRTEYFPSRPREQRSGVGTVFHGAYTKGPELMVSVFQSIHRIKPNLPLIMFGGYPRPAGLPASTEYVRLPPVPAARDLYSRAEVWFCASRSEGFPAPVLEAMACGCSIVATDCGGTADQIQDGMNGFIVPVDDAARMTQRIVELLDNPRLRDQFVTASEAKLKEFTWANAIETLERALKTIVANAAKKGPHKQFLPALVAGRKDDSQRLPLPKR
jgi:glycosyltransferase involved in cell wall biosynthesis